MEDTALVNAPQRRAAVVLQKSLRAGFGLTVTEAVWKDTAVIGENADGVCRQTEDGTNGGLVDSVDEAADQIVEPGENPGRRGPAASVVLDTGETAYGDGASGQHVVSAA